MSNNPGSVPLNLDGSGLRIGVVQARFNQHITNALWQSCLDELLHLGVSEDDILHATVPGALEVPIALARMAQSGEFDALIALGAVIKGDTYHFEVVCNESAAGITRVSLDTQVPVANMILTTFTEEQAVIRTLDKGADAARAAVEMANYMMTMDDNLPVIIEEVADE